MSHSFTPNGIWVGRDRQTWGWHVYRQELICFQCLHCSCHWKWWFSKCSNCSRSHASAIIDTPAIHKHKHRQPLKQHKEHIMWQLARCNVAEPTLDLPDATLVAADNHTMVYQFKSGPSISVLVIPSMIFLDDGVTFIQHGLLELAARNVTLIVDTFLLFKGHDDKLRELNNKKLARRLVLKKLGVYYKNKKLWRL